MPSRTKMIINSMRYVTERPSLLRKFFAPKVGRGKTIWPLTDKQLLRYGFWWDFDGVFTKEEGDFFKYQLQLNAGKIPSTLALWRKTIGGTHATLTSMSYFCLSTTMLYWEHVPNSVFACLNTSSSCCSDAGIGSDERFAAANVW